MIHSKLITWSDDGDKQRLINPVLITHTSVPAHRYACALTLTEVIGCRAALTAAAAFVLCLSPAQPRTLASLPSPDTRPAPAPARHPAPRPQQQRKHRKTTKRKII